MALSVPLRVIGIAIAVHTLWGGNPVAIKFSLEAFPPMWTAFLRFVVGVVCVATWARWQGIQLWPKPHEWSVLVFIGVLFAVQIGLMNIGFDHTTGAMGSVIIATNPIFAVGFAHLLVQGDRLTPWRLVGLLLAMVGTAVVLIGDARLSELDYGAVGNWILLLSACLLGFRLATTARVLRGIDEARVVVWQMLVSLPLFAAGALLVEPIRWEKVALPAIAGVLYQGVFVAGLAFMTLFYLVKRYRPSVILSFNFVSPVAGVALSVALLGERAAPSLVGGMLLVAVGLWLVSKKD